MAETNINPVNTNPAGTNVAEVNERLITGAKTPAITDKKPRATGTHGGETGRRKMNTKVSAGPENAGDKLVKTSRKAGASKKSVEPATAASSKVQGAARALEKGTGAGKGTGARATKKPAAAQTKASIVLKKLKTPKGVTVEAIMEATGWQAHSVRGFLSAIVRKKLALNLVSETGRDGSRSYRTVATGKDA